MKIIKKICGLIDTVNDAFGKLFSLLVIGILAVIMVEVILRRLFSRPQIWTQDMIIMLFACYIILISAYGFLKKSFVAVDIIFARLPKKGQYIMHLVTYIVFFVPFTFALLPESWKFFMKSFLLGEKGYSVWAPVVWPEKLCFFIGILLLAAQGISEMLKQIIGITESSGADSSEGKDETINAEITEEVKTEEKGEESL